MDDKTNHKYSRAARNRASKQIYRKTSFFLMLIIIIIIITIGVGSSYFFGDGNQITNELEEQIEREQSKSEKKNNIETDSVTTVTNNDHNTGELDYDDFVNTYVSFRGKPYNSPILLDILILGEDYYRTFNRWDFDMTSEILETKIDGNNLTLKIDSEISEIWGKHSETGEEHFTLDYMGDQRILHYKDQVYYPMSIESLQKHYKQSEIDYARVIMTINGVPSLDQWAVFHSKNNDQKPLVKVLFNNEKATADVYSKINYPTDVTHLEFIPYETQYDVITYSSIAEGYIKRYKVPSTYNEDELTQKEFEEIEQQVLDNAEDIYIEPFEPYEVAEFIGNVKFIYE